MYSFFSPWNESSLVWGFAVCLAEHTCYTISCTLMGLHKFKTKKNGFFIMMKNAWAALGRLHRVVINPWKQKQFRQLVNGCLALLALAGDTAWHTSSNTHLVIVSSVEFGCPRDWTKEYLGLFAHVEVHHHSVCYLQG